MKNVLGMSVVGSDYDDLKQYNLAEIYDPTQQLEAKASNGTAPEVEVKDDSPPLDVVVNESGPKDGGISMEKSEDDKASLESQDAADHPPAS